MGQVNRFNSIKKYFKKFLKIFVTLPGLVVLFGMEPIRVPKILAWRVAPKRMTSMASFVKAAKVESVKSVKVRDFLEGENYDGAGLGFFGAVLPGFELSDACADRLQKALRIVCDGHKRIGKDGKEYCDLYFGKRSRVTLGAIYGDGGFGGLLYGLASAFEPKKQQAWLIEAWNKEPAGTIVKPKRVKPTK